jgi:hypothetical protein
MCNSEFTGKCKAFENHGKKHFPFGSIPVIIYAVSIGVFAPAI